MANSPSSDSMIDRIVRVLETFTADRSVQSASQIGRRAALPSSTAHRIVDELVDAGLLGRDEDRRVHLGMRLWELALRGSTALRLRQAALPYMERVQTHIRQHTQLAVLEQDEALFLERLSHPDAGANITRIAGRLPLHASSSGLVLLAHAPADLRERVLAQPLRALAPETVTDPGRLRRLLAGVRRDGVAIAQGSIESVSTGVAVPIRDAGEVVAALSVVLPRQAPHTAAIIALREAVTGIEARCGPPDSRRLPFNGNAAFDRLNRVHTERGIRCHVEGDAPMSTIRTRVAIVGAGPAGLLLSHLLAASGLESVVIDQRSREEIETTIRAGILEQGTVEVLDTLGAFSRARTLGDRHDGIELRFAGSGHRIDFADLVGRGVWLYPQHEVLKDLIAARLSSGQDLRFGVTAHRIEDPASDRPRVIATGADGSPLEIEAEFVVGADGSRSVVREAVTGSHTGGHFREYPFAWFGILCEAPPSADELIYSNSPDGFALISQRSTTVQRMYFQCDPRTDPSTLTEEQLWEELQKRVPGTTLKEGPVFQRDVLRFRSFVALELLRGRLALIGDAAHTVPPTGAKGMNLAVADVLVLERALRALLLERDSRLVEAFPETALHRIWKAQHFSWWMTSMLHVAPDARDFDRLRQLGELQSVVESEAGRRFLAEAYTGWPLHTLT